MYRVKSRIVLYRPTSLLRHKCHLPEGPPICRQFSTEARVIVGTGPIQSGYISIAAAVPAMRDIVSLQIVLARETSMTARHPADVKLVPRVALQMTLEAFLVSKATVASRDSAEEPCPRDARRDIAED